MTNTKTVSAEEVAEGVLGVFMGIQTAINLHGDYFVSFFLDLVPYRGGELWDAFRKYQQQRSEETITFTDFVEGVVAASLYKITLPKECQQDEITQQILADLVRQMLMSADVTRWEQVFEIYNGSGPLYDQARPLICRDCPLTKCKHNMKR